MTQEALERGAGSIVDHAGAVFWITGLPGAGKTSIGRILWQHLRAEGRFSLFLDGDRLRAVLGNRAGHSTDERLALAKSYAALCQELSSQGADVVCATVSMFEAVRRWNRANLPNYFEVYVRAPMEVLRRRDQKGLYTGAASGRLADVPGINQAFEEPQASDLIIDNDDAHTPHTLADRLFRSWRTAHDGSRSSTRAAVGG